ncbi:alpha/beta hydrolase [Erythrobacter litoralis]|uniref:Putative lipase/esterase n=1 Tax=Erythrobacter litoralis (strain HTCC2594) TaxID=314225 RepID=Q2N9Y4_ERYLH|nr:alpha/beta hydrolase [Erythrobacter litoralis]ABC63507.1 putative lipase/esterase [Erythrobacter litoralis HTCC2594]
MQDTEFFVRDDVRNFLAMLEQAGGAPIDEVSLEEARAAYMALHQMADAPARELAVIKDLSCPGPAGDIGLRLYDTQESRDPGPVIVFYHGGGFVIGDLDTHNALCTEIAAQMDLPVVAVDYRLAPEHPFPAPIEDCIAATRWIAGSPDALGRGATGVIPIGDSAGGNATIVVSQALAQEPADAPVVLQVPIFPLASDSARSNSIEAFAEGFVLTKAAIEFFEAAYKPDKNDPRAMPILGRHEDTPPTVLVTASLDPIRDSGRDYAAALAHAGIDHVFLEVEGGTHSFTNLRQAVPSYQRELDNVIQVMKLMLAVKS